jgi:hypothetical protein
VLFSLACRTVSILPKCFIFSHLHAVTEGGIGTPFWACGKPVESWLSGQPDFLQDAGFAAVGRNGRLNANG